MLEPEDELEVLDIEPDAHEVIFPILFVLYSVNQRFPSGPAVITCKLAFVVGILYSVTVPAVVILPILFAVCSVNQRFPSGPVVISSGLLLVGALYSVIVPAVVILPILSPLCSVNQRFPSGPVVIPCGRL